ncbi:MAG: Hpt domain-containing protein [Deltaproteobacteria bacterium]|nr:Hpt domain-containing protein [Deltaproteobacteria bacterium]MBI3388606.1 Hpt domain-containing protein [Deltaproteobacteria bacterium]
MSADSQSEQQSSAEWIVHEPFNAAMFQDYVGNDTAVARRVVHRFLADAPGRLAAIQQALAAGDAQVLARAAHALKGAVSFFAADAALETAREVETIARTGDLQEAASACVALGNAMSRLTAALEEFLTCAV